MDFFDLNTKKDIIINNVNLGYFVDSLNLSNDKFDFIEEIYVISLENRNDRRIHLMDSLKKVGINKVKFLIPKRIQELSVEDKKKLNGVFIKDMENIINYSVLGCFVSHLLCHKDAFDRNLKNCIIIEDDCEIKNISDEIYNEIKKFVSTESFDALYLHHGPHSEVPSKYIADKLSKRGILKNFNYGRFDIVNKYKNIQIFSGTGLTHFIIFSRNIINKFNSYIIENKKNVCKNYDFILHQLAYTHDFYTTKDILTTQIESFSDITFVVTAKGF